MSQREYWVGLPVGITVDDGGTVHVEVDMSEASSEMADLFHERGDEALPGVDERQMLLDCAVVDGERPEHANRPVTRMDSIHLRLMSCPVRYGCAFKTSQLHEMAEHVGNPDSDHSRA